MNLEVIALCTRLVHVGTSPSVCVIADHVTLKGIFPGVLLGQPYVHKKSSKIIAFRSLGPAQDFTSLRLREQVTMAPVKVRINGIAFLFGIAQPH